jgi:hypothetical protein
MRRAPVFVLPLVVVGLVGNAGPARAQGLELIPGVQEIATDTIQDLAIAAVDQPTPVIYYNPRLTRRYGPAITRFFLAHEYGHIYHRHTRAGLADLPEARRDSILQAQELEADCYAASQPGPEARGATEAALRFFARLGPFRFDAEHPTGAQRAARLLTCLPPGPAPSLAYRPGDTGVDTGPVSGEVERVCFRVRAPDVGRQEFANDAVLWMDGQKVGSVSNLRFPRAISVDRFGAGIHVYRLTVDVYGLDESMQLNPNGQATGVGHLLVRDGDAFSVQYVPGSPPRLVRETDDAGRTQPGASPP